MMIPEDEKLIHDLTAYIEGGDEDLGVVCAAAAYRIMDLVTDWDDDRITGVLSMLIEKHR